MVATETNEFFAAAARVSLSQILADYVCLACSGEKWAGYVLCTSCYNSLSPANRMALPLYVHGFLFADERPIVEGGLSKAQFKEILGQALQELGGKAEVRSQKSEVSDQGSE